MAHMSWDQITKLGNFTNFYNKENLNYKSGHHTGVDITLTNPSKTIWSFTSGTVEDVRHDVGGYGNHIIVKNDDGYYTLYGHLNSINGDVKKGARVEVGKTLGVMGNTGNSTGDHLHLEIRTKNKYGTDINPSDFFMHGTKGYASAAPKVDILPFDLSDDSSAEVKIFILRVVLVLIGLFLLLTVLKTGLLGG